MKTLLMTISLSILCLVPVGVKSQTLETIEDGTVQPPLSSETIGTFNSVVYVRYKGQFVGVTQAGQFVVPYEVTVPLNPSDGNGIVIFEPPHIDAGPVAREVYLGPNFLFASGFSHASVGYGNLSQRLLNSNSSYKTVIKGMSVTSTRDQSEAVTDTEILQQFVLALKEIRLPFPVQVNRIYAVGFSDSGNVLHQMYKPFGHKFFDLSIVCTEHGWYAVAGGAHIADEAARQEVSSEGQESSVAGTTPINWLPFIRALLVTSIRN